MTSRDRRGERRWRKEDGFMRKKDPEHMARRDSIWGYTAGEVARLAGRKVDYGLSHSLVIVTAK